MSMPDEELEPLGFDESILDRWSPAAKGKLMKAVAELEEGERQAFYCTLGRHCDGHPHAGFPYEHARADQYPPAGDSWLTWLLSGGRGSGKTRSGAEYMRRGTEITGRLAFIGRTAPDVRETMVEGMSGFIKVCELAGIKADYKPALRRIEMPNGARIGLFSAEEPDRLRGPQHGLVWGDEPAHWDFVDDVWSNMLLGLRLKLHGAKVKNPHVIATTTPLPKKWLRDLMKEEKTRISRVSTYENRANLAEAFFDTVVAKYAGTRLGKQELEGEVLEDVEGALWTAALFKSTSLDRFELNRVVVAIDPAGSNNQRSDETGIIGLGRYGSGLTAAVHVLADRTAKYSPHGWALAAQKMYDDLSADAIVVEKNFGGDMVKANLRNEGFQGRIMVKTASKSKKVRAEPVVGLYEQGRVFHRPGLVELEEEQTTWVPDESPSPNRIDALVWGVEDLIDLKKPMQIASSKRTVQRTGQSPRRGARGHRFTDIFGRPIL